MPFLYIIYSAITWCLYPLVVLWIWYRAAKGKADIKRWREYIGYPSLATCIGSKKLLWVHAASLGEIKAVSPVINRLNTEFPDITILITTTTRSGEEAARTLCSDQVIHQYVCVDCPQAIGRFLIFWQPDYVIFVESEFWPCTLYHIAKLKKKGVKVMLLNARMSPSSLKKWQYFESLLVGMLRVFDIIIAASKRDAKNFAGFSSIQKIKCFGNIKYAINNPEMQNKNNQDRLMLNCNSRSVWLCASIHPGEGKVVLESHNRLRNKIPNLLTIIVPRHMTYCKTLSQEMDHLNIKHVLRSDTDKIIDNTEIYLVDTFGELGELYRFADVAFIGGSLISHGGQNVLEAVFAQVPAVIGPHFHNFADIVEEMLEQNSVIVAHNGQELADATLDLLTNPAKKTQMIRQANQVMGAYNNVLQNTMNEIAKMLSEQ